MSAQILAFPGCKAIAREAQLNNTRDNAQIVADYTAAVIRGAEAWSRSPGSSLNQSIGDSLVDSGLIRK